MWSLRLLCIGQKPHAQFLNKCARAEEQRPTIFSCSAFLSHSKNFWGTFMLFEVYKFCGPKGKYPKETTVARSILPQYTGDCKSCRHDAESNLVE